MIRYTEYDLPLQPYISGETPRPVTEPLAGLGIQPYSLSEVPLMENQFFLYGVDLYNHHYFWEAHESWELVWKLEENSIIKDMIKGLIQAAGGYLKILHGLERGTRKLWHRSSLYLSRERMAEMDIDFASFLDIVDSDNGIQALSIEQFFIPLILTGVSSR